MRKLDCVGVTGEVGKISEEMIPVASAGYARPRTRGELWDLLLGGVPCEVVTDNVEITTTLLDGWLATMPYKVRPSENEGWSVFERA